MMLAAPDARGLHMAGMLRSTCQMDWTPAAAAHMGTMVVSTTFQPIIYSTFTYKIQYCNNEARSPNNSLQGYRDPALNKGNSRSAIRAYEFILGIFNYHFFILFVVYSINFSNLKFIFLYCKNQREIYSYILRKQTKIYIYL